MLKTAPKITIRVVSGRRDGDESLGDDLLHRPFAAQVVAVVR